MRHDRWRRGPLAGVSLLGLGLASWRPLRAGKSAAPPDPGSQVLFTPGPTGYKAYRIPVLLRIPSGRLFAFCEGRWGGGPSADAGHIDLVFRTSDDDGSTWSPARLATDQGGDTASNPAPTFDPGTGHIVLLSTRNRSEDTFAGITAGTGQPRRVYVQRCTDPEALSPTFDPPTEITAEVRQGGEHTNPGWHWYATGPHVGAAITAGPHAGRLVVPGNHTRPPGASGFTGSERGQHLIYSDGHGYPGTWKIGAQSSKSDGVLNEDETALTLLANGSDLYVNCRLGSEGRYVYRADGCSTDGGASYRTPLAPQGSIVTSECQGSLLTLPDGRLVYAGPSYPGHGHLAKRLLQSGVKVSLPSDRLAMAVRVSEDEGRTFRLAYTLSGLPAAYSSLAYLPGPDRLAILYETGSSSAYATLTFDTLPLSVLA